MKVTVKQTALILAMGLISASAIAADGANHLAEGAACEGFGPQTPRDIDSLAGNNKRSATLAPSSSEMNLCNIHFHKNAEHKAKAFAIYAGEGDGHGFESGYQCGISKELSKAELAPTKEAICKGEHDLEHTGAPMLERTMRNLLGNREKFPRLEGHNGRRSGVAAINTSA